MFEVQCRVLRQRKITIDEELMVLFSCLFQDVWKEIYEKGPMFSHDQYMKVLELLHRSDPNSSAELHRKHAAKLTEIIKRIGVAV